MRKGFVIFITLIIICATIIALLNIPYTKEKIKSLSDSFFYGELESYSNNFEINELKTNNQCFYYNNLSDENKKIYTSIANGVKNLDNKFVLKDYTIINNDTTMKDVEKSMQAFFADHPEVFYVDNEYTVTNKRTIFNEYIEIDLNYSVISKSDLDYKIKDIKTKMDIYLNQVEDKSGFEAELALHDLLGENVEYNDYVDLDSIPQESHTIYGVFVKKKAVCDGFAKALQIMLDRKDIESIIVLGNLENESHAWNMVKLDEEWYHLDLTSNKSIKDMESTIVLHTYFNLTTDQMEKTHKINDKELVPKAIQTKYNYYKYTNNNITVMDDFNAKFKQILDNNYNQYIVEFGVSDVNDVAEKMVDFLSRNRYKEYISNNKITYYSLLDSYVLAKTK